MAIWGSQQCRSFNNMAEAIRRSGESVSLVSKKLYDYAGFYQGTHDVFLDPLSENSVCWEIRGSHRPEPDAAPALATGAETVRFTS